MLTNFLCLKNVLADILSYIDSLKSDDVFLKSYIQGSDWRNRIKIHGEKLVFPLFMFFDDYESGNVLGSHSGIHKLGAVYISISFLPPKYSSTLSNIFLGLLIHSSDRATFGNRVVFQPLIEEFNFLITDGINIESETYKGRINFELALILGDNLGIHSITGFCESFSANFPSRICKINKKDLKYSCHENEELLRNKEEYERDLMLRNVSLIGIVEKCIRLDVQNFDLFSQVGIDIMHDMLEGCGKWVNIMET